MSVKGILVGQSGKSIELADVIDENSTNETIPSTKAFYDFFMAAGYFTWGDEDAIANESWFMHLSDYLKSSAPKASWIGKTKRVTLTSAVLGTTTHYIRCIGINQDGENTVTFQTKNCLNEYTPWSSNPWSASDYTSALWTDTNCQAKLRCEDYYNAFPGKSYIKTVSKGYCTGTDQSRGQTSVTYLDMNVFLLSEREFGLDTYSPITAADSTTTNAECTYGYNEPYSYFTDRYKRIFGLGDDRSSGSNDPGGNRGYPWERSRYSGSDLDYRGRVCDVNWDGSADGYGYVGEDGLAPAFVIG